MPYVTRMGCHAHQENRLHNAHNTLTAHSSQTLVNTGVLWEVS